GRGEMEGGDLRDQPAVRLFGKRTCDVARTQARLDVADRYLAIKCGERTGKRRRRISLYENDIRRFRDENSVEARDHVRKDDVRRLIRLHHDKIEIDHDVQVFQEGGEQALVLARGNDERAALLLS